MQRRLSWLLLGIIVLFLVAAYTDLPGTKSLGIPGAATFAKPRVVEGLDIKGGVRALLCAGKHAHPTANQMSVARNVIENRLGGFGGLSNPEVSVVQSSPPCIDAELPGVTHQRSVIKELHQTGLLVLGGTNVQQQGTNSATGPVLQANTRVKLITKGQPDASSKPPKVLVVVPGKDVVPNSASLSYPATGGVDVNYSLNGPGTTAWANYTASHVGYFSPVILDGVVKADPVIQSSIPNGQTQVSGLGPKEAQNLMNLLNYGALPVSLHPSSINTVSATLGPQYVRKAEIAGLVGLLLVALFMLVYYRLPGLLADIALLIYACVVFALFKIIPVTLTLPGIAGFILSIGMAVDANVLIFERMKEELRAGKTLGAAIDSGFNRAWTSIRDSNISTMITTIILYWFGNHFGTTIITSFATTLFIGVAVSMFTAIVVTRTFLRLLVASGVGRNPALYGIERPRSDPAALAGGAVV